MQNLYIIYKTSLDTGDCKLIKTYSSFNNASNDLKSVINWDIENNYKGIKTKIISNEKCVEEIIRNDLEVVNGVFFVQKRNSVIIYKKHTDLGWIRNNTLINKIGKIGIDELTIKLGNSDGNNTFIIDNITQNSAHKSSNYEHGRHVSLIEEIKCIVEGHDKLSTPIKIEKKPVINLLQQKFISDLQGMKIKLKPVIKIVKNESCDIEKENLSDSVTRISENEISTDTQLSTIDENGISEKDWDN